MSHEPSVAHRPPGHRRRVSVLRIAIVVVLAVVAAAGLLGVWALVSGTPSTKVAPEVDLTVPTDESSAAAEPGTDLPGVPLAGASGADDGPVASDAVIAPAFRVTDVTPAEGSTIGGEAVVVTGTGFREGVQVRIAGRDASSVQVLNERKLRVLLPPGLPGEAEIEIASAIDSPVRAEGLFRYVERPPRVIMAIRPTVGALAGGTVVTIVGTGFEPGARVVIGGERALEVEVVDSTKIYARTPPHDLGVVDVVVRNPDMPAAVLPGSFDYVQAPTLADVSPQEVPYEGGVAVTLTGTGFEPGIQVGFNGVAAPMVTLMDDTRLTAVVPSGIPGPITVSVLNPGQPMASLDAGATYIVLPDPTPEPVPSPTEAENPDPATPPVDPAAEAPVPAEVAPAAE